MGAGHNDRVKRTVDSLIFFCRPLLHSDAESIVNFIQCLKVRHLNGWFALL